MPGTEHLTGYLGLLWPRISDENLLTTLYLAKLYLCARVSVVLNLRQRNLLATGGGYYKKKKKSTSQKAEKK